VSPRGGSVPAFKASPFSLVHPKSAGSSPRGSNASREGLTQRPASSGSAASDQKLGYEQNLGYEQKLGYKRGEIAPGERSSGEEEACEPELGRSRSPFRALNRPTSLRKEGWGEQIRQSYNSQTSPPRREEPNALSSDGWTSAAEELSDSETEVRTPVKDEPWRARPVEGEDGSAGSRMVKDNELLRKQITRLGTELASLQKDLHSGRGAKPGASRRKSSVNFKPVSGSVSEGEDRYARSNHVASQRRHLANHDDSTDDDQEEGPSGRNALTSHRISYSASPSHLGGSESYSGQSMYDRSRSKGSLGAVPEMGARKSPTGSFAQEKRQSIVSGPQSNRGMIDAGRRRSSKTEGGVSGVPSAKMRNAKGMPDWR
jgi:hypothetical protein